MQTDAVSGIFSIWALTNKETHSPWVGGQPQDNLVTGTAEPPQLEDCRSKHQKINKKCRYRFIYKR